MRCGARRSGLARPFRIAFVSEQSQAKRGVAARAADADGDNQAGAVPGEDGIESNGFKFCVHSSVSFFNLSIACCGADCCRQSSDRRKASDNTYWPCFLPIRLHFFMYLGKNIAFVKACLHQIRIDGGSGEDAPSRNIYG